jgi:hypothetical protein
MSQYDTVGQWKCLADPRMLMDNDKYINDLIIFENNENYEEQYLI